MFFVFLTSGLFLGWSLGANDAANVYGTAVATRMLKFRTAAIAAAVLVLLGAIVGGAGATHTLGKLGAVNALAGSFTVALAAALTVTWMTKLQLPVSTSQAVVGAIIGWNFFSGSLTDYGSLTKIVSSWVLCPVLSAGFAIVLLKLVELGLSTFRIHLFRLDRLTRIGLFLVGGFASYSLGANNIANVSTKGYRKQSVRFKEYLDSFVRKPPVEGQTTDPRHITVPKPTENPTVFEVPTGPNDTGLNNIDIDIEMADLAENHLFFNVGARLLAGTFDGLKKSIAGRPHG